MPSTNDPITVTILGAHGQIARLLTPLLAARGHVVRGLIRNADQSDDLRSDGAEPVICDLEAASPAELDEALRGSDVVVFAAGAGAGSGPERKKSLDRDGAIKSVEAAARLGVEHFVIVSSMGADDPPDDDETFSVYLRAKAAADEAVRTADIRHTIVRPGGLTDDPPTGKVLIGETVSRGSIPRQDVAAVLAVVIDGDVAGSSTFEVVSGDTEITEAVSSVS